MKSWNGEEVVSGVEQGAIFHETRRRRKIPIVLVAARIGVWDQSIVDFEKGRFTNGLSQKEFERWMHALDEVESRRGEFRSLKSRLRRVGIQDNEED